jgi:hypothetical protein
MYKIMVHISADNDFNDDRVCVQLELPAVPRKGEILCLGNDIVKILEDKAKADLETAQSYAPKWFYGRSYECSCPKNENLEDLSFSDAMYITSVLFHANSDIIHVEIDRETGE